MSDTADDIKNDAQEWAYDSSYCGRHRVRYLDRFGCPACEDGDPPVEPADTFGGYRGSDEASGTVNIR